MCIGQICGKQKNKVSSTQACDTFFFTSSANLKMIHCLFEMLKKAQLENICK